MKAIIISDTHDNGILVSRVIDFANEHKIRTIFHAGDIINPGIVFRFIDHFEGQLHFVFGNNDGEKAFLQKIAENNSARISCYGRMMIREWQNKKIAMIHEISLAKALFITKEYDLVIGGHDHTYCQEERNGRYLINPGNLTVKDKYLPKMDNKESSFVVWETETMKFEKVDFD